MLQARTHESLPTGIAAVIRDILIKHLSLEITRPAQWFAKCKSLQSHKSGSSWSCGLFSFTSTPAVCVTPGRCLPVMAGLIPRGSDLYHLNGSFAAVHNNYPAFVDKLALSFRARWLESKTRHSKTSCSMRYLCSGCIHEVSLGRSCVCFVDDPPAKFKSGSIPYLFT